MNRGLKHQQFDYENRRQGKWGNPFSISHVYIVHIVKSVKEDMEFERKAVPFEDAVGINESIERK